MNTSRGERRSIACARRTSQHYAYFLEPGRRESAPSYESCDASSVPLTCRSRWHRSFATTHEPPIPSTHQRARKPKLPRQCVFVLETFCETDSLCHRNDLFHYSLQTLSFDNRWLRIFASTVIVAYLPFPSQRLFHSHNDIGRDTGQQNSPPSVPANRCGVE